MAGMSRKEIARLLDHIEPQGVRATRTTKGVMLRFPDGKTTAMLHWTGSDVKEKDNVKARLKRAGISWPGTEQPLGIAITEHRPHQRTLERAERALLHWEQRSINGSQLSRLMVSQGEKGLTNQTAQRVLFHLGWIPTGKTTARKWLRPLELEPEPVDAEPETAVSAPEAEQATQAANITALPATGPTAPLEGDSEPVELRPAAHAVQAEQLEHTAPQLQLVDATTVKQHPAGREYIDTADSWTADPAALPEGMTIPQLMALWSALGLEGEIRVWRRTDG